MTGQTKSPEGAGKAHEKMKPVRLHFFLRFSQRAVAGRHGRGFVHSKKSSNQAQFVKIAKEITKFCQKRIEKCRKIFAKRIILNYNKKYSRCYYQFVHQNLIQSNIRERER